MMEAIFGDLARGIIATPAHGRFRRGFRAMIDQEIETAEMNRLLSALFMNARVHLKNAELELENSPAERQHLEYARLEFVNAVHLDASLPAARAACYAGFCHRLRGEPQELTWYERSLSMIAAIKICLEKKVANKSLPMADAMVVFGSPILDFSALLALDCMRCVRKNLDAQMQILNEHKEAMIAIVRITKRTSHLKGAGRRTMAGSIFIEAGQPGSLLR
jgi:hypothetical protein